MTTPLCPRCNDYPDTVMHAPRCKGEWTGERFAVRAVAESMRANSWKLRTEHAESVARMSTQVAMYDGGPKVPNDLFLENVAYERTSARRSLAHTVGSMPLDELGRVETLGKDHHRRLHRRVALLELSGTLRGAICTTSTPAGRSSAFGSKV